MFISKAQSNTKYKNFEMKPAILGVTERHTIIPLFMSSKKT